VRVADGIFLCRRATTNLDGTTTLEGVFDTVGLSKLPDELRCMAYCKLEAEPEEIGTEKVVRLELASAEHVAGSPDEPVPLVWFERKANIRGAALGATPTLEILLEIEARIERAGNYFVTVHVEGELAGKAPVLVSAA